VRNVLHFAILLALLATAPLQAAVNYDAGVLTLEGVQVFQDADDPTAWYYLPQYPRVARNEQGDFQFLLLKQVGGDAPGGIFHALIEFTLDESVVERVQAKLQEVRPGAKLVGALPLLQPGENDAVGGFRVISATLDPNAPPDRLTGRVVASGPAPLTPGSRAAIAARLSAAEATVLMDSMTGATSDLSIAIRGYYEAKVRGYNATVRANMDTIYSHRSVVDNLTKGYTKREARRLVDELHQDGAIEVDVYDRTEALGLDAKDLAGVLDVVTDKLIEVMFDTETGWSRVPDPEVLLAQEQIKGRQEKGWFGKIFGGPEDLPYYTDDQYVLKNREDIRSQSFFLNLSKSTVIRIPFDTTGNIGGFYDALTPEVRAALFRVVDLEADADLQQLDVRFHVDGQIAEGFEQTFNNVAVNVRQAGRNGRPSRSDSLYIQAADLAGGDGMRTFRLSRLGDATDAWREFEYQVAWSLRGQSGLLRQPADPDRWLRSSDGIVTLLPPLERKAITILTDTREFENRGVVAAVVQIMSELGGEVRFVGETRILSSDSDPLRERVVYHDPGEPVAFRIVWHTRDGKRAKDDPMLLEDNLINVAAPAADWLAEHAT